MVTGSRDWRDIAVIRNAIESIEMYNPDQNTWSVINGCATGADAIARSVAIHLGWDPEDFWPDYVLYDFATANKNRNMAMVDSKPDVVYAFPTLKSRGTWHAVHYAEAQGYILHENLFIFSEQKEVRRAKDVSDFPKEAK